MTGLAHDPWKDATPLRLAMVVNGYPSALRPWEGTFAEVEMRDMRRLGARPIVICPETLLNLVKPTSRHKLAPASEERFGVPVYRPRFLSFSSVGLPWEVSRFT